MPTDGLVPSFCLGDNSNLCFLVPLPPFIEPRAWGSAEYGRNIFGANDFEMKRCVYVMIANKPPSRLQGIYTSQLSLTLIYMSQSRWRVLFSKRHIEAGGLYK